MLQNDKIGLTYFIIFPVGGGARAAARDTKRKRGISLGRRSGKMVVGEWHGAGVRAFRRSEVGRVGSSASSSSRVVG